MSFHRTMAQANAVVGYQEGSAYVHVPECRLSTLLMVCRSIVEEFGVSEDEVTVSTHHADRKSWVRLTVPLGTEKEVVEEERDVGESGVEAGESPKQERGYVKLTDKVMYRVENGELVFVYENNGERKNLFRVDMEDVYALYEELPEKADKSVILDTLDRLKVRVPATHIHYLMQFMASYPVFGCEVVREGNRKVLVKRDSRITEMSDKLAVEREVIGTPWEV